MTVRLAGHPAPQPPIYGRKRNKGAVITLIISG